MGTPQSLHFPFTMAYRSNIATCVLTFIVLFSMMRVDSTELENGFVRHFGNDPSKLKSWETARDWMFEAGVPKLKKFCAEAHRLAKREPIEVEVAFLRGITLSFEEKWYPPRRIIVAAYGPINSEAKEKQGDLDRSFWLSHKPRPFYLTEGLRSDCAYLVTKIGAIDGSVRLEKHVCGINTTCC